MRPRRSALDVVLPLAIVAVQFVAAYVVLGVPDLTAARDFLTGTLPTMEGSVAAAQVLLWALLAVAFAAALVTALTRTVGLAQAAGRSATWSASVVLIGLLILAGGANHRVTAGSVHFTGGSMQEARAQLNP